MLKQRAQQTPREMKIKNNPMYELENLSSSQASSSGAQPCRHEQQVSYLHYGIYQMLMNGETSSIDGICDQYLGLSGVVWKPNNNTVLHVAAGAGQLELVNYILDRDDQRLLHYQNSEGDLPIHVAVRAGHQSVVERLVEPDHQVLERENNEQNTALHIALENHHEQIANLVLDDRCRQTFYHLNAQGISPIYLAIKAQFWDLVTSMLEPGVGNSLERTLRKKGAKSVVHAAITARNKDILEKIINTYKDLIYTYDEYGQTPLSYAAHIGFLDGVKYFLEKFPEEAFQPDKDGFFPIHKGCSGGNADVVEEFLKHSPNTKWLLNNSGQNIFHIAAGSGKAKVVELLLRHEELDKLINMKDKDGNSPLHLATMGKHAKIVYAFTWDRRVNLILQNNQGFTALDLAEDCKGVPSLGERLTWLALLYANVPRSPDIRDDKNIPSPNELENHQRVVRDKGDTKKYKDRLNTLLMVSTLIATMTFAASYNVPGGYSSSEQRNHQDGTATLAHHHAFQIFVLSDTIALYTSVFAAVTLIWAHLDDQKLSLISLDFAMTSLTIALTMMSIAFMTGLFVVLSGVCDWLAIVVVVLGCASLPMVLVAYIPLYYPSPSPKNKFVRYILHFVFTFMFLVCDSKGH